MKKTFREKQELRLDDVQKEMLAKLQRDYMESSRETRRRKEMVANFIKANTVPLFTPLPTAGLHNRDLHIIKEFLRSGKKTSAQIVAHLNSELRDKPKHWIGDMDSNRFMTIVGKHIEMESDVEKFRDTDSAYPGYTWRLL